MTFNIGNEYLGLGCYAWGWEARWYRSQRTDELQPHAKKRLFFDDGFQPAGIFCELGSPKTGRLTGKTGNARLAE